MNEAINGLMALGADTSRARHLGQGMRDIVSFSPLGVPLALADLEHYARLGDPGSAALAAAAMVPGGKAATRAGRKAGLARTPELPMDEAGRMARNAAGFRAVPFERYGGGRRCPLT